MDEMGAGTLSRSGSWAWARSWAWAWAGAASVSVLGCGRSAGGRGDGGAEAAVAIASTSAPAPPVVEVPATPARHVAKSPPPPGEAVRSTVPRFDADPLLRAHLPALKAHFGADAKGPFDVQRVGLAGGATGLLVTGPRDADPLVLVVDRDRLLWSKERPVAGILPPVRHLALAPGPADGVVVFGWVESLGTVAARTWADDSNAFGDFEVVSPDRCDFLSAAFEAAFGWVVVCASPSGDRAARMTMEMTMPWGHRGVPVGAPSPAGPASIAFDSPASFVVLQRAASPRGERVVAYRLDGRGADQWTAPLVLDGLGIATDEAERIRAGSLEKGCIRAEPLSGKAIRGQPYEVTSDGVSQISH